MEDSDVRKALMIPYHNSLVRRPAWSFTPFPARRIYDYAGVKWALENTKSFSHAVIPDWVPRRFLNPIVSASVLQPAGPRHNALRDVFNGVVSAGVLKDHHDYINWLANDLVSDAVERGEPFNLAKITDALTYQVICEIMGVGEEINNPDQCDRFFGWMDEFTAVASPLWLPRQPQVWAYFAQMKDDRLRQNRNEQLDKVLRSSHFSDNEKLAMLHIMQVSATITTAYTMSVTWALLKTMGDPQLFNEIQQSALGGSSRLVTLAYMEALRHLTPSQLRMLRVIMRARRGNDRFLPSQFVEVCFASANRDPLVFGDDADVYNPKRSLKPGHLAFGVGEYECPGRGMSTKVANAAITALMRYAYDWRITNVKTGGRLILRMRELVLSPPA